MIVMAMDWTHLTLFNRFSPVYVLWVSYWLDSK